MLIDLRTNLFLPDLGWLDVGIHDVPDGLAAALVYQGTARLVSAIEAAPERVKAVVPPTRARAARKTKEVAR
jgi:hypothetical protein